MTMNAYLHSVRKPLKACCRPHTGTSHTIRVLLLLVWAAIQGFVCGPQNCQ